MADAPLTPDDLDRFRREARSFLAFHTSDGNEAMADDPRGDRALDRAVQFQRAAYAAGFAGLGVPTELGGRGLPPAYEEAWREEAGRFPLMTEELSITLGNCLPTLLQFGTVNQRRRFVPRILSGTEVWCQLFSEPGAGSDLAGVQTRATPVAGGWLINGQKVWTTLAHRADRGILLARSDATAPKHAGLSVFLVDLQAVGVDVRPIHQLDGGLHFDEVFLTDVFVPADGRLGPEGDGWRIASAMLHHQRVARAQGQRGGVRHERTDRLVGEARRAGLLADPVVRDELMRLYTAEVCQSVLVTRSLAAQRAGADPGPIGSLGKLANALTAQRFAGLVWRIGGLDALAWDLPAGAQPAKDALFTLSLSIAGGTNEIQRSILAERVLGLPREPATAEQRTSTPQIRSA